MSTPANLRKSPTPELPFHPLSNCLPLLECEAYAALVEDIRTQGLIEPVVLYEGMVLDGRNRVRACGDADEPIRTMDFTGDDPVAYVISA